jgi:nucleotide-binding universal stress UspA family protein
MGSSRSRRAWRSVRLLRAPDGRDLIFTASHGRKGVSALGLGSETTKDLTHSTIPTLVCR